MAIKILLILIVCYVAFEIIEHLVLPLVWIVTGRKRKAVTGAPGLVGETAEVKEWHKTGGRVFVHGEIWRAESDGTFKPGDRVVVRNVEGLTLEVAPLLESDLNKLKDLV